MGYLRKMRQNQQSEPVQLYTYEPPFREILDPTLDIHVYHFFIVSSNVMDSSLLMDACTSSDKVSHRF